MIVSFAFVGIRLSGACCPNGKFFQHLEQFGWGLILLFFRRILLLFFRLRHEFWQILGVWIYFFDLHCNTESVWCCVFGIHGKFVRPIRAAGAEKIGTFDQNPAGFSVELCTLLGRTLLDPAPRRLAEKIRTLIQPRSARALISQPSSRFPPRT